MQSKKYLPLTLIKRLMNIAAIENSAKFSFKMSFDLGFLFLQTAVNFLMQYKKHSLQRAVIHENAAASFLPVVHCKLRICFKR